MEYVTSEDDDTRDNIVKAVRRDTGCWDDWFCVRLEFLKRPRTSLPITEIRHIIDMYLRDKQGSVFANRPESIDIFCKHIHRDLLDSMGRQIVELCRDKSNIAAFSRVYNLVDDADAFLKAYSGLSCSKPQEDANRENDHAKASDSSDQLSLIGGRKVLLVEDDAITRWMVKMALQDSCRLAVAPEAGKLDQVYPCGICQAGGQA